MSDQLSADTSGGAAPPRELRERHPDLAVIPADGEFTDLGIGGFAAAAVDELVATALEGDTKSAADAQAALALLLRLAGRGAA